MAMTLSPSLRKFALTSHITSSVGWLGAVAAFLVLAVAGLVRQDAQIVRAVYLATELITWWIIIPLAFASLLTGIVQGLGTSWGLFRHYRVLAKLLITVLATILLLVHVQPIGHLARVVAETTLAKGELAGLRLQLVADAGAALVALLVATALSIYKPRGMTPYGRRMQHEESETGVESGATTTLGTPGWVKAAMIILIALVLLFVIRHLTGGGLGGHFRG